MESPELKKVYFKNVCSYILNFYMSVCNTAQKEIYYIDFHRIRNKHINYASIDARKVFLENLKINTVLVK